MNIPFLDLQKVTQHFEPALSTAVNRVVQSGWYVRGQETAAFEKAFAEYVGAHHCIGVGNGLDALTLVLMAWKQLYDWDDKAEVIVPAFTFVASAQAIRRAGLQPVLCDIGEDGLIDAASAAMHITKHTRALLPVHLYGQCCNMEKLYELGRDYHLAILEDCAQAHGATCHGQKAGTLGVAAAFSFYPGKNLGALGDGGAVVTNDEKLAERVRSIANYGSEVKYLHRYEGLNSRLDEIQAAALQTKLPLLDEDNARRRHIAEIYNQGILSPYVSVPTNHRPQESVYHIYPILTRHRSALSAYLLSRGIQTLSHYPIPIHRQPSFSHFHHSSFPVSERFAAEELSLPISPVMTDEEAHYVVDTLNRFSPAYHEPLK